MWELDCEEGWAPKNWCFWTVVLEKTLEGPLDCKEIQPVHSEGDQPWDFFGRSDTKAETPVLWPPHVKSWLIGKDCDAGRDWGQEEKGTTEDEMAGWHHWLDGRESEWTSGVGDGQGGLAAIHGIAKSQTRLSDWTELMDINLIDNNNSPNITLLIRELSNCRVKQSKAYLSMKWNTMQTINLIMCSVLIIWASLVPQMVISLPQCGRPGFHWMTYMYWLSLAFVVKSEKLAKINKMVAPSNWVQI